MPRFFLQTKTSQKTNGLPQWNLKDLLRHPDKDLETRSRALNDHVRSLENLRQRLSATLTPRTFLKGLQLREMIAAESSRLAAYAQLWFAQNTQNQRARAFDSQVRKHLLPFSNRTVFFDLWWQRLGDQTARRLLRHAGKYHYHLESLRRVKHHTLSEAEEQMHQRQKHDRTAGPRQPLRRDHQWVDVPIGFAQRLTAVVARTIWPCISEIPPLACVNRLTTNFFRFIRNSPTLLGISIRPS